MALLGLFAPPSCLVPLSVRVLTAFAVILFHSPLFIYLHVLFTTIFWSLLQASANEIVICRSSVFLTGSWVICYLCYLHTSLCSLFLAARSWLSNCCLPSREKWVCLALPFTYISLLSGPGLSSCLPTILCLSVCLSICPSIQSSVCHLSHTATPLFLSVVCIYF